MKISEGGAALCAAFAIAACGGGKSSNNADAAVTADAAPDAAPDATLAPDAHMACTGGTPITLGAQDIIYNPGDGSALIWGAPVTPDLGDGGTQTLQIEFYSGIETSLMGTFDLAAGNQSNYSTCAACLMLYTDDASGNTAHTYFQDGGSITLTQDPFTGTTLAGSFTGVSLIEVTVDPQTFVSTPVAGGTCIAVPDTTLAHDAVPNAYTCAKATYNDGTTCDCNCGVLDPDCFLVGAPVTGCTGQVCAANTCVAPVGNDTCQTAVALTVGTPQNGTTVGATSNYDSGLETASCTGGPQPGGDVAYSVSLTQGTSYTFTLSNVDPSFDPSLALVGPGAASVCDASPIVCLAGADAGLDGGGETFQYTPTATGTYYVIVDSFAPEAARAGAFTVEVTTP